MFSLIIAFLCALYILFILRAKKRQVFYYLLPFVIFVSLPVLRIGIFNPETFIDLDLSAHQGILDMLLNPSLFKYDEVMQFLWGIYPKGYHALLSPLVSAGIPLQIISKFICLNSILAVPLLLYYLSLVIFSDKRIACLSALFSYTLIPIYELCLKGTTTTLALPFYLLTLIFLFKYFKNGSLANSFYCAGFLLLTFWVHFVDFFLLLLPIIPFLMMYLLKARKIKKPTADFSIKGALVLAIAIICIIYYWLSNCQDYRFANIGFVVGSGISTSIHKFSTAISFFSLLKEIGLFPILPFLVFVCLKIFKKAPDYRFQNEIFFVSIVMLVVAFMITSCGEIGFLCVIRHIPFIALFLYLSALPTITDYIFTWLPKRKAFLLIIIFFSFWPAIAYIKQRSGWGIMPYAYHRVVNVDPRPKIMPHQEKEWFKEILAVSDYLRINTPVDTLVASPLWCGDLVRFYSKRNVTSSWLISGYAALYRRAADIYLNCINNSQKLYTDPDYLHHKYKVSYFVFDKSGREFLTLPNVEIFTTKNLKIVKVTE